MKLIRAVFCGEPLVGKSSIIHRFSTQKFAAPHPTIAASFHSAFVRYSNQTISLELWDTAGSERYHSVIPSFFHSACAVVVVYDVTARETFERLKYWLEFARVHSPTDCQLFLVVNKVDLYETREVTFEEGMRYSEEKRLAGYAETSAKSGEAIDVLFELLAGLPGKGMAEMRWKGKVRELNGSDCVC
jgi:small GTP-binding protein